MIRSEHRRLFSAFYILAVMLVVVPLAEGVFQAWPPHPENGQWRYGVLGYLGNSLALPLIGVLTAFAAAALLEHRSLLRGLSVVGTVGAVLLFGGGALLTLEWWDLRVAINPEVRKAFDSSALKALGRLLLGGVLLLWTGWSGLRASRRERTDRDRPSGIVSVARESRSAGKS